MLTLYQKVSAHERIKHHAAMTGPIVHKASQVVGDDLKEAIGPLNQVNFKNRAHQEQLKGVLEVLGTRELTGKDPDRGVWARTQDAVAALRGVFDGLSELPHTDRACSTVWASQFISNCLTSRRLTPKPMKVLRCLPGQ